MSYQVWLRWSNAASTLDFEVFEVTVERANGTAKWSSQVEVCIIGSAGEVHLCKGLSYQEAGSNPIVTVLMRQRVSQPAPGAPVMPSKQALDSIDCYSSSDVLFLFPRGSSLPPRQLWGNSETLKEQSPYFNTLLSSGFEESAATFPVAPFQPSLYDVKRKRQALQDGNDLRKALADSRANAEANGGNGKEVAQTSKEQGASTMEFVEEFESEEEDDLYHLDDSDDEDAEANLGPNRVPKPIHRIVIRDTPFKTYRALLYYLATQQITFATLSSALPTSVSTSDDPPTSASASPNISASTSPLPVSPKSIYKLSHQLEFPSLQKLALENYSSQLGPSNVVVELFSDSSVCYTEMREVAMKVALEHWKAVVEGEELKKVEESVARGELSGQRVALAFELLRKLHTKV